MPGWSVAIRDPIGGLLFAREANRVGFVASERLAWLGASGEVVVQTRCDSPITLAATSEDASMIAVLTADQRVRSFASDLRPLWDREVIDHPLTVAIDPLGCFVAVSDTKSSVSLYDPSGSVFERVKCPRPVVKLAFLPNLGYLVCVGDLGWLGAYDLVQRDWAWRGTLFFNAAWLAVSAADSPIVIGSFSNSVSAFDANGGRFEWRFVPPPAREVQFTGDGRKLFLLTREGMLRSYTMDGQELPNFETRSGVSHFKIDGFGNRCFLATLDGRLEAV